MTKAGGLFDAISCPVCSSSEYDVVADSSYSANIGEDDLLKLYSASSHCSCLDRVVKCSRCSMIYLNPRPVERIIAASYSGAVDPAFVEQNEARIATFDRALRELMRKNSFSPHSHPRILDIGCAGGAFLKAAQGLGFQPVGVEPSRWLGDYARREVGVDVRTGFLHEQQFEAGSFDIVSLWDVLEHLPNPTETLNQVAQLLRPGGYLLVNYPDVGSFAARLLGRRWPFWLSVHLAYYTRSTIRKLLELCGYKLVRMKPYWQILKFGYVMERASVVLPVFRIAHRLSGPLHLKNRYIRYNMGQTLIVAKRAE